MLHPRYQELTIPERVQTVGMIIHAFQNDEEFYHRTLEYLEISKAKGVFDGVLIVPTKQNSNNQNDNL